LDLLAPKKTSNWLEVEYGTQWKSREEMQTFDPWTMSQNVAEERVSPPLKPEAFVDKGLTYQRLYKIGSRGDRSLHNMKYSRSIS
jgi:hypothetical protein